MLLYERSRPWVRELACFSMIKFLYEFVKNPLTKIDSSFILIYVACESGKLQKWRNWQTRTVQVRVVVIP